MPTAYTDPVRKGEVDFPGFVQRCAHAFIGAMRDVPPGSPLPEHDEPSRALLERVAVCTEQLAAALRLTDDEAEIEATEDHERAMESYGQLQRDWIETKTNYESMLERVERWEPPTPDHNGLKEFMVAQLKSSIEHDCGALPDPPTQVAGREWRAEKVRVIAREIVYYSERWREEIERIQQNTAWVRALLDSLDTANTEVGA